MTATVKRTARADKEPFYPTSDGEPMAESDLHWEVTSYCINALRGWFEARPDVYVAGDNFLYYEQGKPKSVVSPDCYVIFGVEMRLRDSYKAWENGGRLPDVVIEITSKSTRGEDTGSKFQKYQDVLQTAEYFLFDPTADYIASRLTGYRLGAAGYTPIAPNAQGHLYSEQLGLELTVQGDRLRFYDAQRGAYLPDYKDMHAQIAQALAELEALKKQLLEATSLRPNEDASDTNNGWNNKSSGNMND